MEEIKVNPDIYNQILKLTKGLKGKVLDVGAGSGRLTLKLAEQGLDVTPCDKHPENFSADGSCDKVDVNDGLPYKNETFDVVVCSEVIEHLENPWHALKEFHHVLKPKGILVISTPNISFWFSRLYFLLYGELWMMSKFYENLPEWNVHISPVCLEALVIKMDKLFVIKKINFTKLFVPLVRVGIPLRNKFFGENMIIKMVKV